MMRTGMMVSSLVNLSATKTAGVLSLLLTLCKQLKSMALFTFLVTLSQQMATAEAVYKTVHGQFTVPGHSKKLFGQNYTLHPRGSVRLTKLQAGLGSRNHATEAPHLDNNNFIVAHVSYYTNCPDGGSHFRVKHIDAKSGLAQGKGENVYALYRGKPDCHELERAHASLTKLHYLLWTEVIHVRAPSTKNDGPIYLLAPFDDRNDEGHGPLFELGQSIGRIRDKTEL